MKIFTINFRCILLIFASSVVFLSCTKTTPEIKEEETETKPEEGPDEVKALTYVYSSENQLEFSLYQNDVLKSSFEVFDEEKKFGNRAKYFRPQTMTIKTDSLYISKLGGYKESHKIKWEKEKLFIYQDQEKDWRHFATKNDKNQILLNVVLYNSQIKSTNSNALRSGQLYNPASINEILSEKSRADMKTIWLKIQVMYVPQNKES